MQLVRQHQYGYTLMEMVVAIAIFASVVVMATTIIIATLQESRRATQARAILDQAQAFLDQAQYDIANAKQDYFGFNADCLGSGEEYPRIFSQATENQIVFVDADDACVGYVLQGGQINKIIDAETMSPTIIPMTDPSVLVSTLTFLVAEDSLETQQPVVTIIAEMESLTDDGIPPLSLQRIITVAPSAQYHSCSVGIGQEGAICPFRTEDFPAGSVVVNFMDQGFDCSDTSTPDSCIVGNQSDLNMNRTNLVTTFIPQGTYRIVVATHDNHIQSLNPLTVSGTNEPIERVQLHLENGTSGYEVKTGITRDIPQQLDCQLTAVEDSLVLTDDIDEVEGCHADIPWTSTTNCDGLSGGVSGTANAFRTICAVFIPSS